MAEGWWVVSLDYLSNQIQILKNGGVGGVSRGGVVGWVVVGWGGQG